MVAYVFQPQFKRPIEAHDKVLTFRRIGGKVHAAPGGRVALDLPQGRRRPLVRFSALCELRASVVIDATGVRRVITAASFNEYGAGLERLLRACEQAMPQAAEHLPRLAALDGFSSWADLWAWQLANRAPEEPTDSLKRVLIGWNPATLRPGAASQDDGR
ncbi:hypothetical protein [Caulobacter sp. BK020]|uniref:hypothetical protein n=1 Tax=Caulobacter sp. BK020 TaxID=2512117 RepID=UPI0010445829|nr:hypothetical protein [Caulobacter sp. BK020]TCS14573.1 hypothetical protein EV278_107222 [Caulobacter sp. BK020]